MRRGGAVSDHTAAAEALEAGGELVGGQRVKGTAAMRKNAICVDNLDIKILIYVEISV